MGPGYFPLILGVILAILGTTISIQSFASKAPDGDKIGKWAWKPLVCVLGSNLAFGALMVGVPALGLPSFGLIVGIYALVFISSLASDRYNIKELFVLSTVLAIGSYLAFVKLLNLQFPVLPWFLSN